MADFEGDKTLRIFIDSNSGEKEIFNTTIKMIERKLDILNIFPSIIPAGVPILFGALILNTTNITSYKWNFGDGEIKTTTESGILKTYSNITNYNISLNVSDSSNLSVQKNFSIETISPKDYINRTLNESEGKLNNIAWIIDSLDTSFKNKIKERLNIDGLRNDLTSIKLDISQATTDEDWLNIALRLSELKIPIDIWEDRIDEGIFVSDSSQIDLEIVGAIFGKTISNSDYKSLISSWEIMNVNGTKKKVKLLYKDYSGEEKTLAEIYKIEVNPKEKSYLVVSKGNGIESSESLSGKGTGKVLELSPGIKKSLELISFDSANRDIYVVIDPTNVELAGEITVCNFNGICEAKLGENYKNCRDDCKPWPRMIILLVVIIVLFFVVYTFIQIQMKKKYELHLFKSEQELQNLIESIKNSRDNNISYNEITDKLIKHGWSKEQINYAIKKSRGEKTRPYELIPMDRILDSFKKKKKNEKLDKKTK